MNSCIFDAKSNTWSADNKFFGLALVNWLGFNSPHTIILPNKHVEKEMMPDSFRNLQYPMDWQGIIEYVGVPAIFKNINNGSHHMVYRVHSVDELIQLAPKQFGRCVMNSPELPLNE